eukprot:gene16504-22732_t
MEELKSGSYNGGFGLFRKVDTVKPFSVGLCSELNKERVDDMPAMIKHYVGITVEKAKLVDLDQLGMNMVVARKDAVFKVRLPFLQPVVDRKETKGIILKMLDSAKL